MLFRSLAKLERELGGVLDLVLNGLYARDRATASSPAQEAITVS